MVTTWRSETPSTRSSPSRDGLKRTQLLAYCDALRLPRGLLIYAGRRQAAKEVVDGTGVTLEVTGLDLEGDHAEVLRSTRRAGRRLVEHAAALPGHQVAA